MPYTALSLHANKERRMNTLHLIARWLLIVASLWLLPAWGQSQCAQGDCDCLRQSILNAQQAVKEAEQTKMDAQFQTIFKRTVDVKTLCLDNLASINVSGFGAYSSVVTALIKNMCSAVNQSANSILTSATQSVNTAVNTANTTANQVFATIPDALKSTPPLPVQTDRPVLEKMRCLIGLC